MPPMSGAEICLKRSLSHGQGPAHKPHTQPIQAKAEEFSEGRPPASAGGGDRGGRPPLPAEPVTGASWCLGSGRSTATSPPPGPGPAQRPASRTRDGELRGATHPRLGTAPGWAAAPP